MKFIYFVNFILKNIKFCIGKCIHLFYLILKNNTIKHFRILLKLIVHWVELKTNFHTLIDYTSVIK